MVVRMRSTRSHTGNRRSHHAISLMRFGACPDCGTENPPHLPCRNCGKYKGRVVVDTAAIIAKKDERRKRKEKEIGKVKAEVEKD